MTIQTSEPSRGHFYIDLFGHLEQFANARDFHGELVKVSKKLVSDVDVLSLLLLAEHAAHLRQWQSAAQLYTYVMVMTFATPLEERELIHNANHILLLVRKRESGMTSRADLCLYAYRRLAAALRSDGMSAARQEEWTSPALAQLVIERRVSADALHQALTAIQPANATISDRYRSDIGHVRSVVMRAAYRLPPYAKPEAHAHGKALRNLVILAATVATSILLAWFLRNSFHFTQVSVLFQGLNWLGAALIAWPLLLIATWIFLAMESQRTRTFSFISPRDLLARQPLIAGEIMPFSKDIFFHIFQFVWLPFLGIAIMLFGKFERLPAFVAKAWNTASRPNTSADVFLQSLSPSLMPSAALDAGVFGLIRSLASSDLVALTLAVIASIAFMANQIRIQQRRQSSGTTMYWWDIRITRTGWLVRLAMVGLDTFLGVILLCKIVAISLVAYELVSADQLQIAYFSPDGVGGLKQLTEIFKNLSWLVFVFGLFVIASIYLHWNLPEYRHTDAMVFGVYLGLIVLTMLPLLILEIRLQDVREAVLSSLPALNAHATGNGLLEAAKQLKELNEIRNWNVSAVSVGLLDSAVLPLAFQSVVVVGQYLQRAGGLPKLSLPGLHAGKNAKDSTDEH